nr:MAG TPA: hypothetical protein [Caudoviricetes sp.]DAM51018.1 MAG TPA: hypothetical protein [Caudoviricetes sp.]
MFHSYSCRFLLFGCQKNTQLLWLCGKQQRSNLRIACKVL